MLIEDIAMVCHEANRALQMIQGDPGIPVAAEWMDIDPEMQESVMQGVRGIQEGNTPEESHANWCDYKTTTGWVYGEVKDEEAKTHPCLIPYDQLPPEQQLKDYLFAAIVVALSE